MLRFLYKEFALALETGINIKINNINKKSTHGLCYKQNSNYNVVTTPIDK